MSYAEEMIEMIREYHSQPKQKKTNTSHHQKMDIRKQMIIKNQRNKFKSNE
jgi:hypothetical protein